MDLKIRIEGADAIRQALGALPAELQDKVLDAALRKGAAFVRSEARREAARFVNPEPSRKTRRKRGGVVVEYDYGRQRRAVRNMQPIAAGETVLAVGVGRAFWGRFLEFGTRRQRRTPWLTPVADRALPQALRIIARALAADVDLVVARVARNALRRLRARVLR